MFMIEIMFVHLCTEVENTKRNEEDETEEEPQTYPQSDVMNGDDVMCNKRFTTNRTKKQEKKTKTIGIKMFECKWKNESE